MIKKPRPGSTTELVINYLAELGPGASISRHGVAEITGKPLSQVGALLSWGVKNGLLDRTFGGDDFVHYTLADPALVDPNSGDSDWLDDEVVTHLVVPASQTTMPMTTGVASVWHLAQACAGSAA